MADNKAIHSFLKPDFIFKGINFSPIKVFDGRDTESYDTPTDIKPKSTKVADILKAYLDTWGNRINMCSDTSSCINHIVKLILWYDDINLDEWCYPLSQCLFEMCRYKDENGNYPSKSFISDYFFDIETYFRDEFEHLIYCIKKDNEYQKDPVRNVYPKAREINLDKLWRKWQLFKKELLHRMTLKDLEDKKKALSKNEIKMLCVKYFKNV